MGWVPHPHEPLVFSRKGGKARISTGIGCCSLPPALLALTLLTGCKPVGPTTIVPATKLPRPTRKLAHPRSRPAAQPGRRRLAAAIALRWNAARQMVGDLPGPAAQPTRRAHRPDNQSLRQALETYLAARDQVSRGPRPALYPTLSAGPSVSASTSRRTVPPTRTGKPTTYNDLVISPARQVGSRISGAASAAPSRPPRSNAQASAADTGQHRPQPSRRDGRRLLPVARPRCRDQAARRHRRRPRATSST
jgi:hypothetical protein